MWWNMFQLCCNGSEYVRECEISKIAMVKEEKHDRVAKIDQIKCLVSRNAFAANKLATPLASTSAILSTFKGSTIPALVMSVNSPLAASGDPHCLRRLPTITLACIVQDGTGRNVRRMIATPSSWSKLMIGIGLAGDVEEPEPGKVVASWREALKRVIPPPGRIPSSTAARVALSASHTDPSSC